MTRGVGRLVLGLVVVSSCQAVDKPVRYIAERVYDQPIIRGDEVAAGGIGQTEGRNNYRGNAMFPTLVKIPDWAPERPDPRAQYYLYFAPHKGTTINVAWADRVDAQKWTFFNTETEKAAGVPGRGVFDLNLSEGDRRFELAPGVLMENHISSPHVYVDDDNQRFILIMHAATDGAGQKSFMATSRTGLNFNAPELGGEPGCGPVRRHFSQTTYLHIFDFRAGLLGVGRSGRFTRPNNPGAPWDAVGSGPLWESSESCPISRAEVKAGVKEGEVYRHGSVFVRGSAIDLFYSRGLDGENEHLLQATIDASSEDWETWSIQAKPETLMRPELDWEQPTMHDSFVYESNGQLYLFYSAGPSGEDSIGLATLKQR